MILVLEGLIGPHRTIQFSFFSISAPWKKSYDKPKQHIKNRDIILSTKICIVKAVVFLVVMYGCESWTVKKAECQRIDAFEGGIEGDS